MTPLAKKSCILIWNSWRIDDKLHVHLQERDNTVNSSPESDLRSDLDWQFPFSRNFLIYLICVAYHSIDLQIANK